MPRDVAGPRVPLPSPSWAQLQTGLPPGAPRRELAVRGREDAASYSLCPRTDRPVLGGPVRARLPGLEPLPLHRPDAAGHGALHHRR